MAIYRTLEGQNIWDLSVVLYGNTESVVRLVQDNPNLVNVGKTIPAGTSIVYTKQPKNTITNYYLTRSLDPATRDQSSPLQGSGFTSGFKINGFN